MKRSLFYSVLVLLLVPAFAFSPVEGNLQAHTEVVENSKVKVRLYNLQEQRTIFKITDLDEEIRYYAATISKHNGYAKILDLSDLADGRYLITVDSGDTTLKQIMKVEGQSILLSEFSE